MRLALIVLCLVAGTVPAAEASTARQRDRAVDWALRQNGHQEIGTSNRSVLIDRWTRDMGLSVGRPWCGALVHHAYLRQGIRLSARLIDPDRSYADAAAHRRGLRRIALSKVRRGDLLFFAFRAGLKASHLALARGRMRNGRFSTIEGNVSHAVRKERRGAQYVVLAARVTAR